MLKHVDDFLFKVKQIVEKENKKHLVIRALQKHFGFNNIISLTEKLLEGDISILTSLPTPYLVELAKDLGIDPEDYFDQDKELEMGEMFQRMSFLEQRILRLEQKVGE